MKTSIALATYNGALYLKEQLDSFVYQSRLPDELVVCDDASDDATVSILEEFKMWAPFRVEIHRNDSNVGHKKNFEKTLSLCDGDIIFLSDQDDIWNTEKIATIVTLFDSNPSIDVIVNDAYYVDENLVPSGVTVLEKVIHVGGKKSGHIAGACTAITGRFKNFLLPFPFDCPQHDIYLHRWANLIGNKLILDTPLQSWRIHDSNTSHGEMTESTKLSLLDRYMRFRMVEATGSYQKKANEFMCMDLMLSERCASLKHLPMAPQVEVLRARIRSIVDAHLNRSMLAGLDWFGRKRLIMEMILKGHYREFKGIKSIAKDLLN